MIRLALAALSVLLAAALAVVAVDVLRVPGEIAADDAGYYGAPRRQEQPWSGVNPVSRRILGVEDDLGFRRAAWAIRRAPRPSEIQGPDQPVLEARAGQAVIQVSEQSRREREPKRRAVLLNFNGVQVFGRYVSGSTAFDRERFLREAIGHFRNAVRLDPAFLDARANLEQALRAAKGSGLAGEDPDAGAARGRFAGTGRSGTGY